MSDQARRILDTPHHKRHARFEWIDSITFELVERWKESELSGEEWRFNIYVRASFKGVTVVDFRARDMDAAMALLPGKLLEAGDMGASDDWLKREKETCSQPGCGNEPVVKFKLLEQFSQCGEKLDPADNVLSYYRQFCAKHRERGDCGREDSDRNYEEIQ